MSTSSDHARGTAAEHPTNAATTAAADARPHRRRATGPHAGALAIVTLAITVVGVGGSAAAAAAAFPSPTSLGGTVSAIATAVPGAVAWLAFCTFGSAVPLGIDAATLYTKLRQLRVAVPGPSIAWFGGSAAAVSLMVTGAVLWVVALPEVAATPSVTLALAGVAFLLGGVGFATGLGLLIAGIAVPGLTRGLLPGWLAWIGLALAVLGELSFLTMLLPAVAVVLPLVRFGGLAWLIAAGFVLHGARVHDHSRHWDTAD
ncbi:hypothetical protein GCM10011512_19330 [Tersicoccus solisilvae]|uniref:DUF4386 domain-containing protein n=1 Tax=Tersicoccus solisilvae TaxID=1882339 RepID=A0ABQ1P796_9MICC|nr:hypothetical protein [Tersicoccus solisilvae]GGC92395.1 hypothetical protein GCM10011512_19330 [Tersicoccus solisilvae]